MRNVVLLHGAWHGAWCWNPITLRLAARGIPAVAVDMDGHGLRARSPEARWTSPLDPAAFATEPSPLGAVTASSAAASFVEQIRTIGGGDPCVVVAHSMGGAVATAAAEQAPELFAHLMYVAAFAPVNGRPTAAYIGSAENAGELVAPLLAADPATVGALRIAGVRANHAALREAFYNGIDAELADAAIALLTPDFPMGVPAETIKITPQRYGTVPHSYVVCERDNAIRPGLQRRMVEEIDAVSAVPTKVFAFDSSHSPFLSHPDELADAITAIW